MPLPQVLAGPIVRRVVGNEVAVWLALREPATVELVVWAGPQRSTGPGSVDSGTPPVARGTAQTKRFGAQLHVAVVVAEASAIIAPGAIHSYDVIVGGQGLRDLGFLRDEARHAGGQRRTPARCASPSATSSTGCRASSHQPRRSATSCSSRARAGGRTPPVPTRWPTSTTSSPSTAWT